MQTNQIQITDTIEVVNLCHLGDKCPNHTHGIIDTTFYFYANIPVGKGYRKVMPDEVHISVNCDNLYKDVFGNFFYLQPEIKQIEEIVETPKLTSFDSIKVGDKVFPAASAFIPNYITHSEVEMPVVNYTELAIDIASISILVCVTIAYFVRASKLNSWAKLINDVRVA